MARGARVNLSVCADEPPRLYVAADLAARLNLSTNPTVERLHFGMRSLRVTVITSPTLAAGEAELTEIGARKLRLPQPAKLHLYRTGRNALRLGPLIGVFISDEKLLDLKDGFVDSVYHRLTQYADDIGAYLVFLSVDDIDVSRKLAYAYRYRAGKLRPVQIALPRVMYDRCFGRHARDQAHWLRELAAAHGITVVNGPVTLTKLNTYEAVSGDIGLQDVVPFVRPLTADTLREAADRFPSVYVKPDNLSKGRGVCRVRRDRTGWVVEQTSSIGVVEETYASADDLIDDLPVDCPYLVQEAIDLATYMGNRYDFRALVQKDGYETWQLTGLVARIAPTQGVVTSPRSGGAVAPPLRVLEESFGPSRGREVMFDLTRTCLRLAARLEEVYGLFAEIGLDIGVTRTGAIRLIEANGRPLKVSLVRLNDPAVNGPIVRQPVNFLAALDMHHRVEKKTGSEKGTEGSRENMGSPAQSGKT